jgi:hypothetical protein
MLLVAGYALPNVRDAHVQLRRRTRSTFPNFGAISTVNVVGCRRPNHLIAEDPFSFHLF